MIWSAKFFVDKNSTVETAQLIIGGTLAIGVNLVMAGLFTASYRDYIPSGKEGLFQGCRIVMYVLVPMIIGPIIAQAIISFANRGVESQDIVYPMELFLGCAAVLLLCFIPSYYLRDEDAKHHQMLINELTESK